MGLDISIFTDNTKEVYDDDYDLSHHHRLSRTFCTFMCRQHIIDVDEGEVPELDQIGKIAGIDISPIYEMERSHNVDIDKVWETINQLIEKLSKVDNIPKLLTTTDFDTMDVIWYFENFNEDTGNGYIDNNFGQDLRNFKRFLEYAQTKGSKTVYFHYE